MNPETIIQKYGGKILYKGKDVFDPWKIICQQNHTFSLLANDLKNGEWCKTCDKIDNILKNFQLHFYKDYVIEGITFKYVIDNKDRKFIIDYGPFTNLKFKIAQSNGYKIIIIFEENVENLKEKIWEALKKDKDSTYIGEKINYNTNHQCTIIETLKFINKDVKSIVKKAPEPYPDNFHMAVGYTRVSTDRQVAEGHSLDAQEAFLAKEAGIRNYYLKAIYIDEGISGKDIEHREALKKMMENLVEGDRVIVYAVERFTRHLKDLLILAEEIKKKKCVLIVPEMDVDFNTPQGGMLLAIRGSLAQYEREITSKRVKDTLGHLKRMGRLANKPLYGQKVNPDKSPNAPLYIRNEEEQKIIDKIRRLRSKNRDLKITAFTRLVNEKIEPPRNASTWYHKMLKDVMIREGIK